MAEPFVVEQIDADWLTFMDDNPQFHYFVEYRDMPHADGYATLQEARNGAAQRIREGKEDVEIWGG